MEEFEREINLVGEENFEKIKNSNLIILGVGGVGGYCAEFFARCGVGNITIVDFDKVSKNNINRQIIALNSTISEYKVDAFEKRLLDINPKLNLKTICKKVTETNLEEFNFEQYDYIIDSIDSFKSKIALIEYCNNHNLRLISSSGAGNRYKTTSYEIKSIFDVKNDVFARKIRVYMRRRKIKKLIVCAPNTLSDNNYIDKTKVLSMCYNIALCGATIVSFVINEIIKKEMNENWAV